MTNINLLPQPGMSLDDIVADTDDGLYLDVEPLVVHRRSPPQLPVRDRGRLRDRGWQEGRLLKNPTYTGITYEFWRSCDAVGDERSYVMLGTPNCGKGEPGQLAHVGHAVPGARFATCRSGSASGDGRPQRRSRARPRRACARPGDRAARPRPRRWSWPGMRR